MVNHANGTTNGALRLPPQSVEAEQGVLGAMLLDNEVIDRVRTLVAPADFYRDDHGVICRAIFDIYDQGRPVDGVILYDELIRAGQAERIAADDLIGSLLSRVPHAANATYHAEIVAQKAIKRNLMSQAARIIDMGYSDDVSANDLMAFAESSVLGATPTGPGRLKTMADAMDGEIARIKRRKKGEVMGVPTGFASLDEMLDGFQATQLIVIAARPGQGKSMVSLNMAEHSAYHAGMGCLFFSQEMSDSEIAGRSLASQSRVDHDRIRTGHVSPSEMDQLEVTADGVRRAGKFWIDDASSRKPSEIGAISRRLAATEPLAMVVVDYLQLLESDGHRESRQEQVARISRDLKKVARQLRVPVIAVSQLNRQLEGREDKRPRLADLRESGAIENDANVVLLLHHPEGRANVVECIVAKNRNGPTGIVELTYLPHLMRFENHRREPDFGPAVQPGDF